MSTVVDTSDSSNQRPTNLTANSNPATSQNGCSAVRAPVINDAFADDFGAVNGEYAEYLKSMINSLLENQMSLSAALDDTRESCTQLTLVSYAHSSK